MLATLETKLQAGDAGEGSLSEIPEKGRTRAPEHAHRKGGHEDDRRGTEKMMPVEQLEVAPLHSL